MKNNKSKGIAISPMATIEECSTINIFGKEQYQNFQKGITEKNAYLLEAMFGTPWSFWINLQKNYDAIKSLSKKTGRS